MDDGKPKLLDQVRQQIRVRNYSIRTEAVYAEWVKRYIRFHHYRHPAEMGAAEIEVFLTHLAVKRDVSASTQNQALAALLFLYKEVLKLDLPWLQGGVRAKKPKHLPVVLTRSEVDALLAQLQGDSWIVANLLYGAGLRLLEALRLRVKDVDFTRREIIVRDGKGQQDRVTMLPMRVVEPLWQHLNKVQRVHQGDLAEGFGEANCRSRWRESIRMRRSGDGSSFSRRAIALRIRAGTAFIAITCMRKPSRGRCVRPLGVLAWSSMRRYIRYVIPLPRIFWKQARTFAPCRSCSATRM